MASPRKSNEEILKLFEVCPTCYAFVKRNLQYPLAYATERDIDVAFAVHLKHTRSRQCTKFGKSTTHVGNGKYQGAWAFTITKSPSDPYSVGDMLIAVRKIMSQKSCPVIKYVWYYEDKGKDELGDPIHPHIHGIYETETGGRIERKHWKRAWSIWDESKPMGSGFRGGYHRPIRSEESYEAYIKKDAGMHEVYGVEDKKTV